MFAEIIFDFVFVLLFYQDLIFIKNKEITFAHLWEKQKQSKKNCFNKYFYDNNCLNSLFLIIK